MLNSQFSYLSPTFSVYGTLTPSSGNFSMQFNSALLYTREFPLTVPVLKERLPSVFSSECFNDRGLPFALEVKNTNFAHLFEHILIEQLCLGTLDSGASRAEFSGRTTWNWEISPRGSYSIVLSASDRDTPVFRTAFAAAVSILEDILKCPSDKKQAV